jgi:hypothetical protein
MIAFTALADNVRLASNEQGAVLLNTRNGQMYGLNPSATVFCRSLADGLDREAATSAVLEAFDAQEAVIRADLDTLVKELAGLGLIRERP